MLMAFLGSANPWILERSATRLRKADLKILFKLGSEYVLYKTIYNRFARRSEGRLASHFRRGASGLGKLDARH
jgi:hypothetical protein